MVSSEAVKSWETPYIERFGGKEMLDKNKISTPGTSVTKAEIMETQDKVIHLIVEEELPKFCQKWLERSVEGTSYALVQNVASLIHAIASGQEDEIATENRDKLALALLTDLKDMLMAANLISSMEIVEPVSVGLTKKMAQAMGEDSCSCEVKECGPKDVEELISLLKDNNADIKVKKVRKSDGSSIWG